MSLWREQCDVFFVTLFDAFKHTMSHPSLFLAQSLSNTQVRLKWLHKQKHIPLNMIRSSSENDLRENEKLPMSEEHSVINS